MRSAPVIVVFLALLIGTHASSQEQAATDNGELTPRVTEWVLDAAGPAQRRVIDSVYMLECAASGSRGTAFLLASGPLVTNAHVISGCNEKDVLAKSPRGKNVRVGRIIRDEPRDLALLKPQESLKGGLELGSDKGLMLGKAVTTWGFPVVYDGPAPVLSLGYVAGFNAVHTANGIVKHIVVNGAFNPGNSGGPVFLSGDDKVVGVVVWRQRLFSDSVPAIINGFLNARTSIMGNFSQRLPNGTSISVSDQEATGLALKEFYDLVQVMIGEAISVSELQAFLREHEKELR